MVCSYSINICYIFVFYEFLKFFWYMFNFWALKVCYIFTIHIQIYPMSSYWMYPSRFFTYASSFILGKVFIKQSSIIMFLYFKTSQKRRKHNNINNNNINNDNDNNNNNDNNNDHNNKNNNKNNNDNFLKKDFLIFWNAKLSSHKLKKLFYFFLIKCFLYFRRELAKPQ